jgi:hypothetical protein
MECRKRGKITSRSWGNILILHPDMEELTIFRILNVEKGKKEDPRCTKKK